MSANEQSYKKGGVARITLQPPVSILKTPCHMLSPAFTYQTLTTALPKFSPLKRPKKADLMFLKPSVTSIWCLTFPCKIKQIIYTDNAHKLGAPPLNFVTIQ